MFTEINRRTRGNFTIFEIVSLGNNKVRLKNNEIGSLW